MLLVIVRWNAVDIYWHEERKSLGAEIIGVWEWLTRVFLLSFIQRATSQNVTSGFIVPLRIQNLSSWDLRLLGHSFYVQQCLLAHEPPVLGRLEFRTWKGNKEIDLSLAVGTVNKASHEYVRMLVAFDWRFFFSFFPRGESAVKFLLFASGLLRFCLQGHDMLIHWSTIRSKGDEGLPYFDWNEHISPNHTAVNSISGL